jgi:hypothetical protein
MRAFLSLPIVVLALAAAPAEAAKILILTDPMTLERRMVVIEEPGPDRVFLCAMPPSMAGCRDVTPRAR